MDSFESAARGSTTSRTSSCDLPRNRLVVITGVSGSGKSSLAFDTIFAEGQRRYVESLSAYARQFLEQMEKPDVDSIEGLSPAISIEQRTTSRTRARPSGRSPRSTTTCACSSPRSACRTARTAGGRSRRRRSRRWWTAPLRLPEGSRFVVLAPFVAGKKGEYKKQMAEMVKEGFLRARVDGEMVDLEDPPELDKQKKHTIEIVVDRLVARPPTTRIPQAPGRLDRDGDARLRRARDRCGRRTGPRRSSPPTTPARTAGRR